MGTPLFGYSPRPASLDEVHEDCVVDYDKSMNRPCIWNGIMQVIQKTAEIQPVTGQLHIDSEFVEHVLEPSAAALVLCSQEKVSFPLLDLWRSDNRREMLVDTYIIGPKPVDPEGAALWEETQQQLAAQLTDHGRKGYPVLEFNTCLTSTK